jgi:hypothetical protein
VPIVANDALHPRRHRVHAEAIAGAFDALKILAAQPARETVFYMERPDAGEAIIAVGEVATIRARGSERFAEAATEAARVFAELQVSAEDTLGGALRAWSAALPSPTIARAAGRTLRRACSCCLASSGSSRTAVRCVSVSSEAAGDANRRRSASRGLFATADDSTVVTGDCGDESARAGSLVLRRRSRRSRRGASRRSSWRVANLARSAGMST